MRTMRRYLTWAPPIGVFLVGLILLAGGLNAQAQNRRTILHLKPQYSTKTPYGFLYVYCETSTGNRIYLTPDSVYVLEGSCW